MARYRLMMNSDLFEYRFQVNKQAFQGPTGTTEEKKAKVIADKAYVLAKEGRSPAEVKAIIIAGPSAVIQPVRPKAAGEVEDYTVEEAIGAYIEKREGEMPAEDESPKARRLWKLHEEEKTWFDWIIREDGGGIGTEMLITDLDKSHVEELVKKRIAVANAATGKRCSNAYINYTSWKLLRRAHNHAKFALERPVKAIAWGRNKSINLKVAGRIEREITPDIALKIENAKDSFGRLRIDPDMADFMDFAIACGLRISNLLLTWGPHINIGQRTITVTQKGKGERDHIVRISDQMLEILKRAHGRDPDFVFTYVADRTKTEPQTGEKRIKGKRYPLTESGFRSWLQRTTKAAGVKITPHDLRRTGGRRHLRASGNLESTREFLGHSSVLTTAKFYAGMAGDDQLAAVESATDRWEADKAAYAAFIAEAEAHKAAENAAEQAENGENLAEKLAEEKIGRAKMLKNKRKAA